MAEKYTFPGERPDAEENFVLVIHGGAGIMNRQGSTPEQRTEYRTALAHALKAGYQVLKLRGEAMDAAIAAVTVLEGQSSDQISQHAVLLTTRQQTARYSTRAKVPSST